MNKFVASVDAVAHKNRFIAAKVQGTLVDRIYHYLLRKMGGECQP